MTDKPKFDPTKPVQTRAGLRARIICTDRLTGGDYPIVALVTDVTGYEMMSYHTPDGKRTGKPANEDLVNIPEKRTEWQNVYKDKSATAYRHETHQVPGKGHVGTLRFDFEDDVLVNVEFIRNED